MPSASRRSILSTAGVAILIAAGAVAVTNAHRSSTSATPPLPSVASSSSAPATPQNSPSASASGAAADDAHWKLIWKDDFDGPAMSKPNPAHWGYYVGNGTNGWGNKELENYSNSRNIVRLDGKGNVEIWTRKEKNGTCWYGTCDYTSGRIATQNKFSTQYGRFEARMKVPSGKGYWPAFWIEGTNVDKVGWPFSGEVDAVEQLGVYPSRADAAIHGPGYRWGSSFTNPTGEKLSAGYHTYRLDWYPDKFVWYLDGHLYGTQHKADHTARQWVFDHPFFMVLNVAIPSKPQISPEPTTVFPQALSVDYVAVYKRKS
jgi:beta-glucanase (GH16 family)